MKRNVIFVLAAFVFAVLVAGCGGASTADIDAKKYGNAPELGNVVKSYKLAELNRDWGTIYDLSSKKVHDTWEENFKKISDQLKEMDNDITAMEKKYNDEKDEKKKEYYGMALEWLKDMKAQAEGIQTARDLFIFLRNVNGEVVVGERIDGNDGYIVYLNLSTGETSERKQLVKENDQWKYVSSYWD